MKKGLKFILLNELNEKINKGMGFLLGDAILITSKQGDKSDDSTFFPLLGLENTSTCYLYPDNNGLSFLTFSGIESVRSKDQKSTSKFVSYADEFEVMDEVEFGSQKLVIMDSYQSLKELYGKFQARSVIEQSIKLAKKEKKVLIVLDLSGTEDTKFFKGFDFIMRTSELSKKDYRIDLEDLKEGEVNAF